MEEGGCQEEEEGQGGRSDGLNPLGRLDVKLDCLFTTAFMHTGPGGVIKDLVKCMQGMRRNSNVDEYEAGINKRNFKSEPHIAS